MNLLLKETVRIFLIIGLIIFGIFLFTKGCNPTESNTRLKYYKENPNTNKTYEQEVKDGKYINDLIEENKRNQ